METLPNATAEFCRKADEWVQVRSSQARSLWAKSGDGVDYLSLPQHMVDSACAASLIFHSWLARSVKDFLVRDTGLTLTELENLYIWLAGTHDLGKCLATFQRQLLARPEFAHLVSAVADSGLSVELTRKEGAFSKLPHGVVSGAILAEWLVGQGFVLVKANAVAAVVNAHHGIASEPNEQVNTLIQGYPAEWKLVQVELADAMAQLCEVEQSLTRLKQKPKLSAPAAQVLTGLVVMADWIASNEEAFTLRVSGNQYERTKAAASVVELTPPWEPAAGEWGDIDAHFRASFGWPDGYAARPVQRAVVDAVREIDEPTLLVLEAETGVGKTEAALAAAEILAAKNGAQGIFFAAPTMATANGLLERVITWARNNSVGTVQSMYLAHSKNNLSKPFRELKFHRIGQDSYAHGDVVAAQWMSGPRRGVLSNFVVGTVDQVLMMALQQRFSMLRHAGLSGKIIIFDEVHTFDTYTSDYLRSAIAWLSNYGASVIVMSATLPPDKRRELVEAYSEGTWEIEDPAGYPLLTVATEHQVRSIEIEPTPTNMNAEVGFVVDDEVASLSKLTDEWMVDGGCVLIICNTIARAQAAFEELEKKYQDDVHLHHAGFVAWERAAKEDVLRAELGPQARRGQGRPWRRIVVATQVAEQSLDIDVDALITDIAPMDLIAQRAGRVHRHQRPEEDRPMALRKPKVFLRGIGKREPAPEFDGGAEAIYGGKLLMATLANLPSVFRRPDDIAPLVRAAYDKEFEPPAAWREAWETASEASVFNEKSAHSRSRTFRLPVPWLSGSLPELFARLTSDNVRGSEEQGAAQVRDTEPTVEVIPIIVSEYGYRPWGWDEEVLDGAELTYPLAFHLASSTVRLPARMTRWDSDFDAVVTALEASTPPNWSTHFLLRGQVALCLEDDRTVRLGRFTVRYSSRLGVEIISDGRDGDV